MEKFKVMSKRIGELRSLEGMKESVEDGLTLKEHMAKYDKGDINNVGKFGKRPVAHSVFVCCLMTKINSFAV